MYLDLRLHVMHLDTRSFILNKHNNEDITTESISMCTYFGNIPINNVGEHSYLI